MNLDKENEPQKNWKMKLAGVIAGGWFLYLVCYLVSQANETKGKTVLLNTGNIGLIENLGKALFSDYVLPFEISSILFLSAMIGAVVIGKKDVVTA
jgi:NADH-quinone oxidoreductase subunit J